MFLSSCCLVSAAVKLHPLTLVPIPVFVSQRSWMMRQPFVRGCMEVERSVLPSAINSRSFATKLFVGKHWCKCAGHTCEEAASG